MDLISMHVRFSLTCCVLLLMMGSGCLAAGGNLPVQTCLVVRAFPHDPEAFTQGLISLDGMLYESTGLYGKSTLRKVDLQTGRVLKSIPLAPQFFGEGLVMWKGKLIQLTWRSGRGFVYDRETFKLIEEFIYPGDGWGITHDGTLLIMSDGTSVLRFLDPETFKEVRRITVREGDRPVEDLNELEFVRGEVLANIWQRDVVARISPVSGEILGWIDLSCLRAALGESGRADVLNGMAYDSRSERLFVTGKFWPKLFEIRIRQSGMPHSPEGSK